MAFIYKVKDWDLHFEGAKSKTYNNKTSCSMPTKHGLGYRRMIREKNGPAIFGAWCSLIQVLSRHKKKRQGYLTDTGGVHGVPYSELDMEILTGIPCKIFGELFSVMKTIGWVEVIEVKDILGIPLEIDEYTKYPSNLDLDSNLDSNLYGASGDDATETWISHRKRKLKGKRLEAFKLVWEAFGYKKGRAKAIDAFLDIPELTDSFVAELVSAAETESTRRQSIIESGSTPIFLQGWISGRRWEDEDTTNAQNGNNTPTMEEIGL